MPTTPLRDRLKRVWFPYDDTGKPSETPVRPKKQETWAEVAKRLFGDDDIPF